MFRPSVRTLRLKFLLTFLLIHYYHVVAAENRPPPPKAAPPLTPPERRKQLITRSSGVACSTAVASLALQKLATRSVKTKLIVVVSALTAGYLLGEQTAAQISDFFIADEETPFPMPVQENAADEQEQNSINQQNEKLPYDIQVEDIDRQPIVPPKKKKKSLQEQIFFWKKKTPPSIPESEEPEAPKWSNAYQKEQHYEEDYGIN